MTNPAPARSRRSPFLQSSLAVVLLLTAAIGCNKPSEDNCKKALANMQHLLGTDTLNGADKALQKEVRHCVAGSKQESVACAMAAKTLPDLQKCNFMPSSLGGSAK